jgi:excisionase family DNA binding protein
MTLLRDAEALPVADATRVSGLSRSTLYRLLATGEVKAIKVGRRTLIVAETLRAYLAAAPVAVIRRADAPGRAA